MARSKKKSQRSSIWSTLQPWAISIALTILPAVASCVSQLTLAPSFGSIPSSVNHKAAIIVTFILGFCLQRIFPIRNIKTSITLLGVWIFCIPALQWYITPYHEALGTINGPILLGFLSCHTIIIPSAWILAAELDVLSIQHGYKKDTTNIIGGLLSLMTFHLTAQHTPAYLLTFLSHFPSQTPIHLQTLLATSYTLLQGSDKKTSRLILLSLPAILHTASLNPHPHPTRLSLSLGEQNWTLLDRAWSPQSGYLSVLENHHPQTSYRLMRADHSLLGGEWLLTPSRVRDSGWRTPEPIYAVFQMLEAVRLVEREKPVGDGEAEALVVGLGIGTTPKALIAHGIGTTVLEMDGAVHGFATRWFGLQGNHTFVNEEAGGWLKRQHGEREARRYDYVIHDVFTGGAEPLVLFTYEFVSLLRERLKPGGVMAVNYAGELEAPLTNLVLRTVYDVFGDGAGCRTFRDTEEGEEGAFANLVVFCADSSKPLTFRKPVEGDYLGSISRRSYLYPQPEKEVFVNLGKGQGAGDGEEEGVLREEHVGKWQAHQIQSARRHWGIMRGLLEPSLVWDLW